MACCALGAFLVTHWVLRFGAFRSIVAGWRARVLPTALPLRLGIAATLLVTGGFLTVFAPRPIWEALGLGLMFPGGGFLLGSHWLLFSLGLGLYLACSAVASTTRLPASPWIIWLGSAAWAAEHAATAGTCQFLELFGYAYAFQYWPAAKVIVPVLGVCLLATSMPSIPAAGKIASLMRRAA